MVGIFWPRMACSMNEESQSKAFIADLWSPSAGLTAGRLYPRSMGSLYLPASLMAHALGGAGLGWVVQAAIRAMVVSMALVIRRKHSRHLFVVLQQVQARTTYIGWWTNNTHFTAVTWAQLATGIAMKERGLGEGVSARRPVKS